MTVTANTIFLIALMLTVFQFSCKKDSSIETPLPETVSEIISADLRIEDPVLLKIATIIGAKNVISLPNNRKTWHKIAGFGNALWNRTVVREDATGTEYIVPFTRDNAAISALLICQQFGEKFKYTIVPGSILDWTSKTLNEKQEKQIALLMYMSNSVFGIRNFNFSNSVFNDKRRDNLASGKKIVIQNVPDIQRPTVANRSEYVEICILFNSNCTCPSDWANCDMCSECLALHCWGNWVDVSDDTIEHSTEETGDPGTGGGSGPYTNITTKLSSIRMPGESFWFDPSINPNFALVFGSVSEFQIYLNKIRNNISYDLSKPPTIINQNERIERGRFNLNFVGGVDVHIKVKKVELCGQLMM